MFAVIPLDADVVRVPQEFKTFRGAQIAAVNLSRQWQSDVAILDDKGLLWGETAYHNWDWVNNCHIPGGRIYARFYCEAREVC